MFDFEKNRELRKVIEYRLSELQHFAHGASIVGMHTLSEELTYSCQDISKCITEMDDLLSHMATTDYVETQNNAGRMLSGLLQMGDKLTNKEQKP